MKTVTFYHRETGMLDGSQLICSDDSLVALNTPADHIAIEGAFDHLCQRVDVTTGAVVDYQPPQPDADHEWNADTKRWQLNADTQARQAASAAALGQILLLEARGIRAARELALGVAGAVDRLTALDAQIAAQRANLNLVPTVSTVAR
jgi:hypothetical protein